MSEYYKIVYTKSGNRYLLDQKNMRWTEARLTKQEPDVWLDLLEWPQIEEGKRLRIVYRTKDNDFPRIVSTSEVLGCV